VWPPSSRDIIEERREILLAELLELAETTAATVAHVCAGAPASVETLVPQEFLGPHPHSGEDANPKSATLAASNPKSNLLMSDTNANGRRRLKHIQLELGETCGEMSNY